MLEVMIFVFLFVCLPPPPPPTLFIHFFSIIGIAEMCEASQIEKAISIML